MLRAGADLREQYETVKRRLAAATDDIDEYGRGKSAVIRRILAAAGLTDAELSSIDANQVPSHVDRPR